jgi:hypothetical protein
MMWPFSGSRKGAVAVPGGTKYKFKSVPEAKQTLKELRLRKKEVSSAKKIIMEQQRRLRASYTSENRKLGSGPTWTKIGKQIRQKQKDQLRKQLDQQLSPLEQRRAACEAAIVDIDNAVLQVQSYIAHESEK